MNTSDDSPVLQADKRAHHNALERKRRDHIKDSFHSLRDSVPALQGEKASRAQILDKATEYIQYMRRKNTTHQQDIDDLKKQNALLEQQGERDSCSPAPTHLPIPTNSSNMSALEDDLVIRSGTFGGIRPVREWRGATICYNLSLLSWSATPPPQTPSIPPLPLRRR
uniref:Protein max n=1 Tax=Gadus morhua TaxID=8049 RepID=A0A8C5AWR9_GADMO